MCTVPFKSVYINLKLTHETNRKNNNYQEDNMELMSRYPDNYFDLAIVDPPYGINANNHAGKEENGWNQYKKTEWDNETPNKEYFTELKRVSKNQIVWGGNYMTEFYPHQRLDNLG
jgi:DNA modification methylase